MTAADHVKAIHIFNEQNPLPNVIGVRLGPRAGRAGFTTRIRLADSQTVTAIAELSDGSFWSDSVQVIVTLPACAGDAVMARTLINVPGKGKARRHHRDQGADPARDGIRAFASTAWARFSRATSSRISCANITARRSFAPSCFRRSPPIHSLLFPRIATESGNITFEWTGDNGFSASASRNITVE